MPRKITDIFCVSVFMLFFASPLCCAMSGPFPVKFVIADNGQANASIVIAEKASPDEKFAADELQGYIRKSSGVTIPVKSDAGELSGNIIAVGRCKPNLSAGLGLDKMARDGFRIKTSGSILSLAGRDDAGTQFAVYSFLEDYIGVRWFWPGELGEVVPQAKTVEVGRIDQTQQPDFKWRNRGPDGALWGATEGPTEMHARELVLGVSQEHQKQVHLWEKRNKWGGMKIYGGHALGEIFPPDKYAAQHPEYYALVGGKRDVPGKDYDYKHECQICTTNPQVIQVTVDWVRYFLDKHPEWDGVHITMNDGGGFCECEKCLALDSGEVIKRAGIDAEEMKKNPARYTVITDRIFTFCNQVSQEVQKTHPGKYVVSMAYSRYIKPPKKISIDPYVIPQYCLWGAYKHSNAAIKKEHQETASAWAKASEKTAIYEYFINGSWPGMHRLVPSYIADSIKYLYKNGIELYQTQAGDEFAINGINYYIAGKLLWDTSLDENKILDDFYQKAFGRSAGAVKRFHGRLQQAWTAATAGGDDVSCKSISDTRLLELFTPELLEQCRQDLSDAEKLAESDLVRKRVEFYRQGLHYTELTVSAVIAARKVEALGLKLFPLDKAKKDIAALADKAHARQLMADAAGQWQARDRFVEQLKDDYVLAYLWVKYTDGSRGFNPTENLKSLLDVIGRE